MTIANSSFKTENGISINEAENVNLINTDISIEKGNLINIYNAKNITFDNLNYKSSENIIGVITGKLSNNIIFKNSENITKNQFELKKSVKNNVLKIKK
ncbi:MAG: hypothetical protein R2771_02200 [Saprospiraceae bacterium]